MTTIPMIGSFRECPDSGDLALALVLNNRYRTEIPRGLSEGWSTNGSHLTR